MKGPGVGAGVGGGGMVKELPEAPAVVDDMRGLGQCPNPFVFTEKVERERALHSFWTVQCLQHSKQLHMRSGYQDRDSVISY